MRIEDLENELFNGPVPVLWHNKCTSDDEVKINEGDLRQKAYCYTADDLNDMKIKWDLGSNNKAQSILNNCMGMYYRNHDQLMGITNPEFIYSSKHTTAAGKAFFINCAIFFGSIGLLILSDKEAGLQKLGSLIALESHKKAFDKYDD